MRVWRTRTVTEAGGSQRRSSRRGLAITLVSGATAAATLALSGSAQSGTPPARLDRNLGWVIPHPRIHLVAWDNDWDSHNPGMPAKQLFDFSVELGTSNYWDGAAQYGVGKSTYIDYHSSSSFCGPRRAPSRVSAVAVQAWITCEVVTPGTHIPYPGSKSPVSNDLYVVMLPMGTRVDDNVTVPRFTIDGHSFGPYTIYENRGCIDYSAYHFFSYGITAFFAFAVVQAECAREVAATSSTTALESLTDDMSHEILESATDPVPFAGWIDDSYPPGERLDAGEAADICSSAGAVPTAPTTTADGFEFEPYWSNANGACVNATPRIAVPVGRLGVRARPAG